MTATENIKTKLFSNSNSISLKLFIIFMLLVLMQIPLESVRGLINERQSMQYQAQTEISNRWGEMQIVGTPALSITSEQVKDNKSIVTHDLIPSKTTDYVVELMAEKRYLGIYEAAIYVAKIQISGEIEFNADEFVNENGQNNMQLFIPLEQLRALKGIDKISIDGKEITELAQQKVLYKRSGFAVELQNVTAKNSFKYQVEFSLAGSQQFEITPEAQKTTLIMQSNWSAPSFIGDYLPDERTISETGFTAKWQVHQLSNRSSVIDNFVTDNYLPSLGVKIIIPANTYQVNERTVKYSFLIIVLAFAGFFLSELFFKLRLHPFQYLMIGFSTSTFYLLLLSISEYLTFNWAFLISAGTIVTLISSYSSVVLQQTKRGIYTGVLFTVLYAFIFVLVKAEEASLLMGATGILFILAVVMYLTRKIDWYAVNTVSKETKVTNDPG